MNVRYMSVGLELQSPKIRLLGSLADHLDMVPWRLDYAAQRSVYLVCTDSGEGVIVGDGVGVDESDLSAEEPSRFFMM
ncbi:hypothetical protein GCM10028820_17220 [Tessaracoccus terricola]